MQHTNRERRPRMVQSPHKATTLRAAQPAGSQVDTIQPAGSQVDTILRAVSLHRAVATTQAVKVDTTQAANSNRAVTTNPSTVSLHRGAVATTIREIKVDTAPHHQIRAMVALSQVTVTHSRAMVALSQVMVAHSMAPVEIRAATTLKAATTPKVEIKAAMAGIKAATTPKVEIRVAMAGIKAAMAGIKAAMAGIKAAIRADQEPPHPDKGVILFPLKYF
jgi:hypothetical protein